MNHLNYGVIQKHDISIFDSHSSNTEYLDQGCNQSINNVDIVLSFNSIKSNINNYAFLNMREVFNK